MRAISQFIASLFALLLVAGAANAASCADLIKTDLTVIGGSGSKVTSASETTKNGIAVCAVEGVLAPAIRFKTVLPITTWTGRYLQLGCGGLCGNISERAGAADGCVPLDQGGFVTASTDMGHQGGGGSFARDAQKRADFAYRGQHLTALASKALIKAYYGKAAQYSYFSGCSDGGREALMEAQRYPTDFNGIIAGAAAMNFEVQNSLYHGWQARTNTGADGKAILTAARLPLLHQAVLKACDGLDGLKDGLIADPRACKFDPKVLSCAPGADTAKCLTAVEIDVVRKLYDGPRDPKTGVRLTVGGPQPGSELSWAGVFVPRDASQPIFSTNIALDAVKNLIFATNPPDGYTLADLRFDQATFDSLRAHHPLLDATNPDLKAFAAAGGKLILWHGWADPHISPLNTIAYHEAVERVMGAAKAQTFERLYLLPGVYHCSGGEGPSAIDFLTPMLNWVESGKAPDAVVARTAKATEFGLPGRPPAGAPMGAPPTGAMMGPPPDATPQVQRARPVYPYPAIATYSGKGDANTAESFKPGSPLTTTETGDWAGKDFYAPYVFIDR